jgi:hypothetical protein
VQYWSEPELVGLAIGRSGDNCGGGGGGGAVNLVVRGMMVVQAAVDMFICSLSKGLALGSI